MKQGVPQGGVLSPLLFNLYLRDIPQPPEGIQLISYADDCTILTTGNNITIMTQEINNYLKVVNDWLKLQHLQLSPEKSSATLFTLWTREVNTILDIHIDQLLKSAYICSVDVSKAFDTVVHNSLFKSLSLPYMVCLTVLSHI